MLHLKNRYGRSFFFQISFINVFLSDSGPFYTIEAKRELARFISFIEVFGGANMKNSMKTSGDAWWQLITKPGGTRIKGANLEPASVFSDKPKRAAFAGRGAKTNKLITGGGGWKTMGRKGALL